MHGFNMFAICLSLFLFVICSPASVLLESRAVAKPDSLDLLVRNKRLIDVSENRNNSQYVPYAVQILLNGQNVCVGCILSARVILTAAICIGRVTGYTVVAGTMSSRRGGSIHHVNGILRHPNYVAGSFQNNIAMLSILEPILLGQGINLPIQIYESERARLPPNSRVIISGWGHTYQSGTGCLNIRSGSRSRFADKIQSIAVRTISTEECRQRNREAPWISSQFICTHHPERRCYGPGGDTGSPVVYNGHLIGIHSWSSYEGRGADVSLNVALPLYRNWITGRMNHIPPLAGLPIMPHLPPVGPAPKQHKPSQIVPSNH